MRALVRWVGSASTPRARDMTRNSRAQRPHLSPLNHTCPKQYTGGPQNLPAGFDGSAGTIPGGYPFTTQITDPAARTRALNCEIQNGRGAMLGVFGCMCHSMLDSTDHHFFYPITHN